MHKDSVLCLVFSFFCLLACGPGEVEVEDDASRCLSDADCDGGATCSRGFCGNTCETSDDCPPGRVCTDGACLATESGTCSVDSECVSAPTLCQTAEGATCESGRCVYPAVVCDDPDPPSCTPDNQRFVQFVTPGICDPTTGACVYSERSSECENCDVACAGECGNVECTDTQFGCRSQLNLAVTPGGGCTCEFFSVAQDTPCPDDDPCTAGGFCDGSGTCTSNVVSDGESCVNNSDEPIDGVCLAGSCVECVGAAQCDDENPCTVNTCEGNTCVTTDRDGFACPLEDGSSGICLLDLCVECATAADCNDGNNCTNDACIVDPDDPLGLNRICENAPVPTGQACLGGAPGICTGNPSGPDCVECLTSANESDGGNSRCSVSGVPTFDVQCRVATCVNNSCSIQNRPDTVTCDDGDAGSEGDVCSAGQCVGCEARDCSSFTIENAQCVYSPAREGLSCNDGNSSTTIDRCNAGTCVGCTPNQCQTLQAVNNGSCVYGNRTEGTTCDDGSSSTIGDRCSAGTCRGCDQDDDFNRCRNFENRNGTCTNVGRPSSQTCDDFLRCTDEERCDGTVCVGVPICTGQCVSGCNESTGQCIYRSGSCNGEPDCLDGFTRRTYTCNTSNGACQQSSTQSCGGEICDEGRGGCVPCQRNSDCGSRQCCDGLCATTCL